MTSATPKKQIKRQPTCPHCKKRFRTTSSKAVYCTRTCKDKAASAKKRVKYVAKATDSEFMRTLAFEASRAGTYEIFTGHTPESVAELYGLYVLKQRANRFGETKDYELSHIAPSQGHDFVGLYHPRNLVVAPKAMNRAHGNRHYGHGLSLDRNKLNPRYMIEKGTPQADIIKGIIQFIGTDTVAEAAKLAGIQPRRRIATLSWLREHLNPRNPQHRDWLDNLDTMHTTALTALKATVQGKEGSDFKIVTRAYTQLEVLLLGLEQQTVYRRELSEVQGIMYATLGQLISERFSKDWMPYWTLLGMVESLSRQPAMRAHLSAPELLQALFDVLHGKEVDAIRPVLEAFAERHSGAVERIPAYAPIVFRMQRPASVVAMVQSPISFNADARSFADCLDEEGRDDVPVLLPLSEVYQVAPFATQVEPLPWD